MLLKDIESYIEDKADKSEQDLMSDVKYVCKSCSLITESLQKGCDVMQMPNGDIIITELKAVTFHYTWDAKKSALVRNQSGNKIKKPRSKKIENNYEKESVKTEEMA